jgi:hypothetical protein
MKRLKKELFRCNAKVKNRQGLHEMDICQPYSKYVYTGARLYGDWIEVHCRDVSIVLGKRRLQ